jgi:Na+/melibiose symporter-like transporter
MLASIMGPIGGGAGYAVYIFFINDEDKGNTFKNGVFRMCCICAIIVSIIYSFVIIFLKEKPQVPPTKSASYEVTEPVCKSLKDLIVNKNFIFVTQVFGLIYACLTTFSQEVSLIISPYGLEPVKLHSKSRAIIQYLALPLL